MSYKQKSEISHSLVGKWPSKNRETRDASVGYCNYIKSVQLKGKDSHKRKVYGRLGLVRYGTGILCNITLTTTADLCFIDRLNIVYRAKKKKKVVIISPKIFKLKKIKRK